MKKWLLVALSLLTLFGCRKSEDIGSGGVGQPALDPKEFQGKGGIYYLGNADIPINNSAFSNPNLAGVVVRFKWENLELAPNIFDWSFIDGEIAKAKASNKRVTIQPLGYPNWIVTALGASSYLYIDRNTFHSTYLDTLRDVITWDGVYLSRVENLIDRLAEKYSRDTVVSYINLIGGQISRGLPDSVVTVSGSKAFWKEFPYNADTVVAKMKPMLDRYMLKFPKTPLWCSVDYVSFENKASARASNYLSSQFVTFGVSKYPERFGCWREDIAACNPQPDVQTTNQWYVMQQNRLRTGAQMLWNVQDGPTRMNRCGILPGTKQVVLDSSFNNGLRLGMRYFEVYAADIQDPSLSNSMAKYNAILTAKYLY